jgi:ribosomal protein S18 acetylase RimI-like enzyme
MTAITSVAFPSSPNQLRRFDPPRDLKAVADLVALCFAGTLDDDGKRYIRRMYQAARHPGMLRWAALMGEQAPMPLVGYVWECEGKVVGNLNLMPVIDRRQRGYQLVNVAVHPSYRRKGIARALTQAALEYARKHRACRVWLHVRDDNPPAQNLYRGIGFRVRARRTEWHWNPDTFPPSTPAGAIVRQRKKSDWPQQKQWLRETYPLELRWGFSLDWNVVPPGFLPGLVNFFYPGRIRHWVVEVDRTLVGCLTWQAGGRFSDRLFMAASQGNEALVLRASLAPLISWAWRRPLTLDYPADKAAEIFQQLGFQLKRTLIWMSYTLT